MGILGKTLQDVGIENFTVTYHHTFEKVGEYHMVVVGNIYNIDGSLYKRDSTVTLITAIK